MVPLIALLALLVTGAKLPQASLQRPHALLVTRVTVLLPVLPQLHQLHALCVLLATTRVLPQLLLTALAALPALLVTTVAVMIRILATFALPTSTLKQALRLALSAPTTRPSLPTSPLATALTVTPSLMVSVLRMRVKRIPLPALPLLSLLA